MGPVPLQSLKTWGDENGDNSKSKGVPTNLKVPTDLSWIKLSFGASQTPVAPFVTELQAFLSTDKQGRSSGTNKARNV